MQRVAILYKTYKGQEARRLIQPICKTTEPTSWYPNSELKVEAVDLRKGEKRIYLASSILQWRIEFFENESASSASALPSRFIEYTGAGEIESAIRSLPRSVIDSTGEPIRSLSN